MPNFGPVYSLEICLYWIIDSFWFRNQLRLWWCCYDDAVMIRGLLMKPSSVKKYIYDIFSIQNHNASYHHRNLPAALDSVFRFSLPKCMCYHSWYLAVYICVCDILFSYNKLYSVTYPLYSLKILWNYNVIKYIWS